MTPSALRMRTNASCRPSGDHATPLCTFSIKRRGVPPRNGTRHSVYATCGDCVTVT